MTKLIHLFRPFYAPIAPRLARKLVPDIDAGRLSFSAEGEDLVLASLFEAVPPVAEFYVDVGAYQPKRFSNTYFFYRRGWRGINIDAMPGSMLEFQKTRPRDINVEAAISATPRTLTYHMFAEQALNTLSEAVARERTNNPMYYRSQPVGTRHLRTRTLTEVLDERLPPGQRIGFLNVDVEGLDLEVAQSLDFARYSPPYILAEDKQTSITDLHKSAVAEFLREKGYLPAARTYRTIIFRKAHHE